MISVLGYLDMVKFKIGVKIMSFHFFGINVFVSLDLTTIQQRTWDIFEISLSN